MSGSDNEGYKFDITNGQVTGIERVFGSHTENLRLPTDATFTAGATSVPASYPPRRSSSYKTPATRRYTTSAPGKPSSPTRPPSTAATLSATNSPSPTAR